MTDAVTGTAEGPVAARVAEALGGVSDPCMAFAKLDVSVHDLGLILDVRVDGDAVEVDLTFTELGCSFSHHLVEEVRAAVEAVEGVHEVRVTPVWSPMWSRERMTPAARAALADSAGRLSAIARARGQQPPEAEAP